MTSDLLAALGDVGLVALGAVLGAGLAFAGQLFITWWGLREDRIDAARAVFYEAWQNSVVLVERRRSRFHVGEFSDRTYLAQLPLLTQCLPDEGMDDVARAFSMLPVIEQTMATNVNVQGRISMRGADADRVWDEWTGNWQKAYRALLVAGWGHRDAKADAMTWEATDREPDNQGVP